MTLRPNEREFAGQPAAPGIAIGPACWIAEATAAGPRIAGPAVAESERFANAVAAAAAELAALAETCDELGRDILEFQVALLEDEEIVARVRDAIGRGEPAEQAWDGVLQSEIGQFELDHGDATASRDADLRDLHRRVLRHIAGAEQVHAAVPQGAVLFGEDMTPSHFLSLDWNRISGLVLSGGSPTSHVAILARSRGVPMVVEVTPKPDAAAAEIVAVDANSGRVVISPGAETHSAFRRLRLDKEAIARLSARIELEPARTADGRPVQVLINVNHPGELAAVDPAICDGIGLVRTEFLFSRGAPDEEEQLEAYSAILKWAAGRPVTIRTLDAGGDKPIAGITRDGETNPFLGLRGLRLSLQRPGIFRAQLRALLRAAALAPLKIMVPMVTLPDEMAAARKHLSDVAAELQANGLKYAPVPIGMMVEVPAAAMTAGDFDADFYSIGSNDLVQYVMAAARDASGLSHLTRADHPAVLELIRRTVEAGKERQVEVSLCGDMASRPEMVATLLDTGLRVFSVSPAAVGRVKLAIASSQPAVAP